MGRLLVLAAIVACLSASAASPAPDAYRFRPVLQAFAVTYVTAPSASPGRLYVVEQSGTILLSIDGKLQKKPFLNLNRIVKSTGEEGLLSMTFSPGWARNRLFYVDYIGLDNTTRIVEYRATKDGTAAITTTARRLFTLKQPGDQHKGGQLQFGPDGKLWFSLGDGECCDDPGNRAQDMSQLFGKLLRIDVSSPAPTPEIVALGLRNPWRFSFDRATRDLYIGDVGAGLWEEIDYQPRAQLGELVNYGWDAWEASAVKEDKAPNPAGRLVFPILAYGHENRNCSITGGFVYRGSSVPAARGRYFYGDYCSGFVWSLRIENGAATDVRREPFRIPGLSTFGEDSRGELYAASVNSGRVYKLVR